MSWIEIVEESEAGEELREAYGRIKGARGKLSNIMQVQSLNPEAMRAHLDLYMAVMFKRSGLSREERELLAVVVSAANRCDYCISHHAEALRAYWKDEEGVRQVAEDFRSVELPARTRAMLEYTDTLTRTPREVERRQVEALREEGFSDEDILGINLIVSYFNFVNRIAVGLGVDFNPEEVAGYRY